MITSANMLTKYLSGINLLSFACIVSGLILVCVEFFRQSKGILAFCGVMIILAGVVFRMFLNPSAGLLFILVFICCFVIMTAFITAMIINKQAWLKKKPELKDEITETGKDYYFLLNLEGYALGDIKKSGKIEINDIEFDVINAGKSILKGAKVRVVEVEGRQIVVKEV